MFYGGVLFVARTFLNVVLLMRLAMQYACTLRPQYLSDTCQRRGGKDMQGAHFSLQSFTCTTAKHTQKKVLVQYLLTIEQMVENDYTVLCTFRTYFQSQNGGCRQPQVSVVQKVLMRSVRLIMKWCVFLPVQWTETTTLFLVHDNERPGANLNLRHRLRHGNDRIRTAGRAIERVHQPSYPVSLQVTCLSCTYTQAKLFWDNDNSTRPRNNDAACEPYSLGVIRFDRMTQQDCRRRYQCAKVRLHVGKLLGRMAIADRMAPARARLSPTTTTPAPGMACLRLSPPRLSHLRRRGSRRAAAGCEERWTPKSLYSATV
jgi:hypothetical protein